MDVNGTVRTVAGEGGATYDQDPACIADRDEFLNHPQGVAVDRFGNVYVADRGNNRLQVFALDGTFVREVFIKRDTLQNEGTVHDFAFSPDKEQRFLYVVDGSNKWVHILNRRTLEIVDSVGGRAGHGAQEFFHIHSMAADSKGNFYLGEVNQGQRYMKYAFKGMGAPTNPPAAASTSSSR